MNSIVIFWFRNDLRLSDNPGFLKAITEGKVMPIFILDEESPDALKIGSASRWWLHHSLKNLNSSLEEKLNFYQGHCLDVFKKLLKQYEIKAVYWSRSYEPLASKQEETIAQLLEEQKIPFQNFNASLLWEPSAILTKEEKPYQVFTPFYRAALLQSDNIRKPLPKPSSMCLQNDGSNTQTLDSLKLLSKTPWYEKLNTHWNIDEKGAQQSLDSFLKKFLLGYQKNRDFPSLLGTSQLSPHLHFGAISPHQIWHATREILNLKKEADAFLRQLVWREFSSYQLFHFPDIPWKNFQSKFDRFPWQHNKKFLEAWQQGKTGYPMVDAGMRELWQTGTIHNRSRMMVASFLTKNLLIDWREGAAWFWDCLVDADLASNSLNWQWVAGCGVDAAPYFRIFNPILQAQKFDPEGSYIRRFLPELTHLPNKFLFTPWEAPETILNNAGIILGKTYPFPIVDLKVSRDKALQMYHAL